MSSLSFEEIEVVSEDGLVRVTLEWIGEGIDCDYDENDPDDVPLLRYSVSRKFTKDCRDDEFYYLTGENYEGRKIGEWCDVEDSSYCTQLPITAPRQQLIEAAQFILSYVESGVKNLQHEKRLYESLSWICLKDNQPYCEQKLVTYE
jgi:hypothetical protein